MRLEFDPDHKFGYSHFLCPRCGRRFFIKSKGFHDMSCGEIYENFICIVGLNVVSNVKEWARKYGRDSQSPHGPSLTDIQNQLSGII